MIYRELDADTLIYFVERLGFQRVLSYNLPHELVSKIKSRGYKIEKGSSARVEANDLVVGYNLSHVVGAERAAQTYEDLSSLAGVMIISDSAVSYAGPNAGWAVGENQEPWAPFGLKLPFSFFDRKLVSWTARETRTKVVAIISTYNEVDIIRQTVEKLASQGVEVHVFDNWSTDGTWECLNDLCEKFAMSLERFPRQGANGQFKLSLLLSHTEEIAAKYEGAWIIHMDSDEIRTPSWPELTLRQGIALVEDYDANAVDFTVVNFRPIDESWSAKSNPEEHFKYCEFGSSRDAYTRQIKMWKQPKGPISLAESAGHEVRFCGRKLFPYKFILKHYPIRSSEQGTRKLFMDRLPRFANVERNMGWHTHYDNLRDSQNFVHEKEKLFLFEPENNSDVGLAVMTGLSPDHESSGEMQFGENKVYVPVEAVVVIDVPCDGPSASSVIAAIERCVTELKGCFKAFQAIATDEKGVKLAAGLGIPASRLDYNELINGGICAASKGYALAETLRRLSPKVVFAVEAGGITAISLMLREQNIEFADIIFATILCGGISERMADEGLVPFQQEHLETEFLEKAAVEKSNVLISPADYLVSEWTKRGAVIKQEVFRTSVGSPSIDFIKTKKVSGICYYGPLTGNNFEKFLAILPEIVARFPSLRIGFVGPFGWIYGEHSGGYLVRLAKALSASFLMAPSLKQAAAIPYYGEHILFVIPKYSGFTPHACEELANKGLPFVVNDRISVGSDGERYLPTHVSFEKEHLQAELISRICMGAEVCKLNPSTKVPDRISPWAIWASSLYGRVLRAQESSARAPHISPSVCVCVPHYERPELLLKCLEGFSRQTYKNFQVIIIDDGSRSKNIKVMLDATVDAFPELQIEVIYQQNAYLGAARNTGYRRAVADYVLFFDDDDYPLPTYIQDLISAAVSTNADVVTSSIEFWDGSDVTKYIDSPKASHFPIGHSIAAAFGRNSLGSAAVMVRKSSFVGTELYTTDYGLGWEDYEFAFRAVLSGKVYTLVPKPLYLYRVNSAGMSAMTPTIANGDRLWRGVEKLFGPEDMNEILRVQFFARVWKEDKTNKWAWLHNLGPVTPLYHRLMEEPFNSEETYALLVELANMEGLPEFARNLSSSLRAWREERPTDVESEERARLINLDTKELNRLHEYAKTLLLMGKVDAAVEIFEAIESESGASHIPTLLALAWINFRRNCYEEALSELAKVVAIDDSCLEAYYASWKISEASGDEAAARSAFNSFELRVVESYKNRYSTEWEPLRNFSTESLLFYWAVQGRNADQRLVSFSFFEDLYTNHVLEQYGMWSRLEISAVVADECHAKYVSFSPDRQIIEIHPPTSQGSTTAHIDLRCESYGRAVCCFAETPDARSVPVEICIQPTSTGEIFFSTDLSISVERIQDSLWHKTTGTGGGFIAFSFPDVASFNGIRIECRNANGDTNNSYATTLIYALYLRD